MSSGMIGMVLGKYRVVEKIGSGGMADVFKGIQIGLDREVAIKVLPVALAQDREMVKRFRRESQSTAKLSHPNIITIYDSGEQGGTYFYVMEFLKSEALEDVLERQKPLPVARATKIGQDVLKALVYCHEKGVCHGDLSPAHVKFDMRENAVLTDFVAADGERVAEPRGDLERAAAMMREMLAGADVPDDVGQFLARPHQTAKEMLAELKKIELRQKAKQHLSKPTQVSRPAEPSAVEPGAPSEAPPRETMMPMLAVAAPVFVVGVALVVWAWSAWRAPEPEPSPAPPVATVAPAPKLAITDVFVTEGPASAVISWTTNVKTNTAVRYGPTEAYGEMASAVEQAAVTYHSVSLDGLKPETTYHYEIVPKDEAGKPIERAAEDRTFRTAAVEPPQKGSELERLAKTYFDKVSRMTPDEREKLQHSVKKFTDLPDPLKPNEKRELLTRPTVATDDADFASRLRMSRRWMVDLALGGIAHAHWETEPGRLQKLFYLNPGTAARKLDGLLRELSEAEKTKK